MSFAFDNSFITEHGDGVFKFYFAQDLRQFFPKTEGRGKYGNNTIGDILERRGVIAKSVEIDTEYSCTYVYFRTEAAGKTFIKRLNALPEVKNYVQPPAPPSGKVVILTYAAWVKLKKFLKANMDKAKFAKLQDLELEVWDTEM